MSLLLDALKKAEQEHREKHQQPSAGKLQLSLQDDEKKSAENDPQVRVETPAPAPQTVPAPARAEQWHRLDNVMGVNRRKRLRTGIALGCLTLLGFSGGWYYYGDRKAVAVFESPPMRAMEVAEKQTTAVPPSAPPQAVHNTEATEQSSVAAIAHKKPQQPAQTPPASVQQTAPKTRKPVTTPKPRAKNKTTAARRSIAPRPNVTVHKEQSLSALLTAAFNAYQTGQYPKADRQYRAILTAYPAQRDALLGLAAVNIRNGRRHQARAIYLKLVQRDPGDAFAKAGLLHLLSRADPAGTESQLKNLLAGQPRAAHLHFYLGTLYASQQRWADAKQHFVQAVQSQPANTEYNYNLAVSLDHLHQYTQALQAYRQTEKLNRLKPMVPASTLSGRIGQLQGLSTATGRKRP